MANSSTPKSNKKSKAKSPMKHEVEQEENLLLDDDNQKEEQLDASDADIYTEPETILDDEAIPVEEGEALIQQIEANMAGHWREEFESMDSDEQQTTLYNVLVERVYWHIAYYMRRFPERMGSAKPMYSDRCVGIEEVRELMGREDNTGFSERWLEANAIPEIEEITERLVVLNAQIEAMMACKNESAIARLQRNFSLSDLEMTILATLVIAMNEESIMRLMCVAWADFGTRLPTVTFLANLLGDTPETFNAVRENLRAQSTLRRMRLVIAERHNLFPGMTPNAFTPLSVDQEVIDTFCGYTRVDELPPNVTLYKRGIPMNKLISDEQTIEQMKYALETPGAILGLVGQKHSGRRTLLCSVAIPLLKRPVMEINICQEFEDVPYNQIVDHLIDVLRRTLLHGCILAFRFDGIENNQEVLRKLTLHQAELSHIVDIFPGKLVVLGSKVQTAIEKDLKSPVFINIPQLSVEKAEEIWKTNLLPYTEPDLARRLSIAFSRNYSLPIGSIIRVVSDAVDTQLTKGFEKVRLQSHHLLHEIGKHFDHQLGTLAEVSVSDIPISGVVLTDECKAQVKEILRYAKNLYTVLVSWGFKRRSPYGNSLSMLFAGPPGTGKTLLANALANELGKVLYRVDLSRIVDKYIGETEKNLGKVFDEAAKAQAIILFDEADALFAKRTEVKSSNDRHANQEINFLLQKLESYNGITILTTNLSKSIDDAFRRRMRFIVDFPMPDAKARASLWKRMMPPDAPLDKNIRWSWLADTFEMSGGHIRNAVLKAAISAAADEQPISMPHLAKAAIDEAHAMGMLLRVDENEYEEYEGEFDSDDATYQW